jgi:hypothetical protein
MTATTVEKKKFTYEDYLKTPDERRYDLIEGKFLVPPSHRDFVNKKRRYAWFGVKECRIVDSEEKTVEIFSLKNDTYSLIQSFIKKENLRSSLLSGLEIKLSEVFKS